MKVEFNDTYRTKITVHDETSSGRIRIDMEGEVIPTKMHIGVETGPCISMNSNQVKILIAALQQALDDFDGCY